MDIKTHISITRLQAPTLGPTLSPSLVRLRIANIYILSLFCFGPYRISLRNTRHDILFFVLGAHLESISFSYTQSNNHSVSSANSFSVTLANASTGKAKLKYSEVEAYYLN